MKNILVIGIGVIALVSCTTSPSSGPGQNGAKTKAADGAPSEALFLHLLAPRAYTDPPVPAHRIVTARVYPSQDFAISVGDPENPFTNRWDGAWTNPRWSNTGSPEVRPLEPIWDSGDAVLAGRIDWVNGKFFAHLQGRSHTTLSYFHGEIELEKPVYEQGGWYRAGAIWGVWFAFALSANPDCSQFLRALEDGSLRRPDVVDQDSPLRQRWERGEQK